MENKSKLILEVKGLKKYFPLQKNILGKPLVQLRAVDDVSFKLEAGKTIGVVGESGCGKTTLGRTILQLYDTTGGKTIYYGHTVEEFLPNYFVNGIKNINKLSNKINSSKNKLSLFVDKYNEYSKVLEGSLNVSLERYKKVLEDIQKRINDSNDDEVKELTSIAKILNELIKLLDEAASLIGGLILCEIEEVKRLLLSKLELLLKIKNTNETVLKNKYLEEISEINQSLDNLKNSLTESELFKDLEDRIDGGLDLAKLTKAEMRSLRTEIQLIFQDPYSSLPPRMTVGAILSEAVQVHQIVPKEKVSEHIHMIMKKCGLQPQYYDRYPHEFSGGQRQRICIARALAVNPKLVICDEPVSALDVSIQAQIINLLKELQNELGLTYMFISHDLSVVKYITNSIIVMYLGNMMEIGDTVDIFNNPLHPYTQALFSAVPVPDPDAKMNRIILKGDIPSPANPPKGCKFHTRCEKCMSVCKIKTPKFIKYSDNHMVACHLYDDGVMNELDKYDAELKELERIQAEQFALDEKNK